jgi:hypothetical protein
LMISDRSWLISAWKANVSVSSAMVVGGGSNGVSGRCAREKCRMLRTTGGRKQKLEKRTGPIEQDVSGRQIFYFAVLWYRNRARSRRNSGLL